MKNCLVISSLLFSGMRQLRELYDWSSSHSMTKKIQMKKLLATKILMAKLFKYKMSKITKNPTFKYHGKSFNFLEIILVVYYYKAKLSKPKL